MGRTGKGREGRFRDGDDRGELEEEEMKRSTKEGMYERIHEH